MVAYSDENIYKTLKELDVIDSKKLAEAYDISKSENKPLINVLLEKDLASDENLGKVIADMLDVAFARPTQVSIPDEILKIIPEIVAKKQGIIAFKKDKEGLHVAMRNPSDIQIRDFLEKKTGLKVVAYFTTEKEIRDALNLYKKDIGKAFEEIIKENVEKAKGKDEKELPIKKIVDTIISYAYQNKASDIHIEPYDEFSLTRFRIDGILHDIIRLPKEIHQGIVTRIKVLAKLRTDEHQAPQDGKIVYSGEDEEIDLRVSIVPITDGEKIVMRLLSERSRQFGLSDLGFNSTDLESVKKAQEKPFGLILVTGPTGSGKTTTIYSILKLLNKRGVNIMTIEDPVEYDIEGVNQIQVNKKTELTFAKGLRSIVRQDPDIILVGEIRDEETASIAVNSAMTGHLVLSTLHTNNAATAVPRLMDMGIEPFLIASTINVIVAQRLVRKIHVQCRVSSEVDIGKIAKRLSTELIEKTFGNKKGKARLYEGKGCELDHGTGYEGRVGIYEVMEVDDDIREAIVARKDADIIQKIAEKEGMSTMIEDGIKKAQQGITTIDEVIRVTKE